MKNRQRNIHAAILVASIATVVMVSYLSYYTGDFFLEVVYAMAILLPSWYAGRWQGLTVTLVSGIGIFLSSYYFNVNKSPLHYVNMGLEIVVLFTISILTSSLRTRYLQAEYMASYDPLTGVSNRNRFFLLAEQVMHEASRYGRPFSLAYIDLDNFKQVNDQQGHHEGDKALQAVAAVMKSNLRQADIIARIGGDEFVVLLPGSDHSMAETALRKLQSMLLQEMKANKWPITFSIGAVSCSNFQGSIHEVLKLADGYLYAVKSQGKNNLHIEKI